MPCCYQVTGLFFNASNEDNADNESNAENAGITDKLYNVTNKKTLTDNCP